MIWIVKTLVRSCRIPGYRSGQSTRLSQPRLHLVGHTHRALLARQPTGQRLRSRTHRSLHEYSVRTLWHFALARRGRHFPGHLRNEPTGAVDLRRLACPFTGGSHRVRHLYARVHDASFVGLRTGPREPNCENRASRNSPNLAVALNCGTGSGPPKLSRSLHRRWLAPVSPSRLQTTPFWVRVTFLSTGLSVLENQLLSCGVS